MYVKICGVTSVGDAEALVLAGADAIGLNFFALSKRYVGVFLPVESSAKQTGFSDAVIQAAREIRDRVAGAVDVVGVFVNSSAADVAKVATDVGLHAVQFHGDESPELIAEFHRLCPDIHIIRAFRIGSAAGDSTAAMNGDLSRLSELGVHVAAVLVDALVPGEYGGTGHQVQADVVKHWMSAAGRPYRLILAGGLTPANVGAAASDVTPWGVDTASGVESGPGIKDFKAMTQFVRAIRNVSAVDGIRL